MLTSYLICAFCDQYIKACHNIEKRKFLSVGVYLICRARIGGTEVNGGGGGRDRNGPVPYCIVYNIHYTVFTYYFI